MHVDQFSTGCLGLARVAYEFNPVSPFRCQGGSRQRGKEIDRESARFLHRSCRKSRNPCECSLAFPFYAVQRWPFFSEKGHPSHFMPIALLNYQDKEESIRPLYVCANYLVYLDCRTTRPYTLSLQGRLHRLD